MIDGTAFKSEYDMKFLVQKSRHQNSNPNKYPTVNSSIVETDKVEDSADLTESTVANFLNVPMSQPPNVKVEKIETNKNALKDQI